MTALPEVQPIPQTFWVQGEDDRSSHSAHVTLLSKSFPILLRTPRAEDVPGLTKVSADPRNIASDLSASQMTFEEIEALVLKWAKLSDPLQHFLFVIILDGQIVGMSGFGLIQTAKERGLSDSSIDLVGAVGVTINPEVRGQGIAREAMRIAIDYGFRVLGFKQIISGTSSENVPMRNLMEKGMHMPATLGERDRFGNDLAWTIEPDTWLSQKHEPVLNETNG